MQRYLVITMFEVQHRKHAFWGLFLQDRVKKGRRLRVMLVLLIEPSITGHQPPFALLLLRYNECCAYPLAVRMICRCALDEILQKVFHGLRPLTSRLIFLMPIYSGLGLYFYLCGAKWTSICFIFVGHTDEQPWIILHQSFLQVRHSWIFPCFLGRTCWHSGHRRNDCIAFLRIALRHLLICQTLCNIVGVHPRQ